MLWSPRGDRLLVIAGKPGSECCDLFTEARYWLTTVPGGAVRELTGLPQEVIFSWSADEQSLYVLDNWRRHAPLQELGERIQRYGLATGELTLLLNRQSWLTSMAELPGGDLLVGQYAGGGHMSYYRLPAGSGQLVTAAPFHMRLSPDARWAVETNLWSLPELAVADVATGRVTDYHPQPAWPRPANDKGMLIVTDPVWAPDSRWLLYTISILAGGTDRSPTELRFFDRTDAEPDRVVQSATAVWLPGPGLQALVFRIGAGTVQPWRYDVQAGQFVGPVGPKVPAAGGKPGECEPVQGIQVAKDGRTAAYVTCDQGVSQLRLIDLAGKAAPVNVAFGSHAVRLLAIAPDGTHVALDEDDGKGLRTLKLVSQSPGYTH